MRDVTNLKVTWIFGAAEVQVFIVDFSKGNWKSSCNLKSYALWSYSMAVHSKRSMGLHFRQGLFIYLLILGTLVGTRWRSWPSYFIINFLSFSWSWLVYLYHTPQSLWLGCFQRSYRADTTLTVFRNWVYVLTMLFLLSMIKFNNPYTSPLTETTAQHLQNSPQTPSRKHSLSHHMLNSQLILL